MKTATCKVKYVVNSIEILNLNTVIYFILMLIKSMVRVEPLVNVLALNQKDGSF